MSLVAAGRYPSACALLLLAAAVAPKGYGQTPPAGQIPAGGLQNAWDVRKTIADLKSETDKMQPFLLHLDPQAWYDKKGAPTTYIVQWQAAQQQLKDVIVVANAFAQKTESLPQGLDVYFRLEALESTERALAEGVQQFDTRANADKFNAMIAHSFSSRERIREYLRELATSTDENFKIADREAQRCRGQLAQPSTALRGKTRR